jgi:Tfp pilus assembly protein PilF
VRLPFPSRPATDVDRKREAQQHYLSGMIYFQKGDYAKAKEEWSLCQQLDPENPEVRAGLERLAILTGSPR